MAITVHPQYLAVELHNILHQILHRRGALLHRVEPLRTTVLRPTLHHHVRIQAQQVLLTAVHRDQHRLTVLRATVRQVIVLRLHAQHLLTAVQVQVGAHQRERALLHTVRVLLTAAPRVQPLQAKDRDIKKDGRRDAGQGVLQDASQEYFNCIRFFTE